VIKLTIDQIIAIAVPIATTILGPIVTHSIKRLFSKSKDTQNQSTITNVNDNKNKQKNRPVLKKFFPVIISGIAGLAIGIFIINPLIQLINGPQINVKHINIHLTMTYPQEGQQLTNANSMICKGRYRFQSKNISFSELHIWLFTMDQHLDGYYIQGPVTLNGDGSWEGKVNIDINTTKVVAILLDNNSSEMIQRKGTGKIEIKDFPKGSSVLAGIGIKI
jgi:hypothetical protein